MAIPSAPFARYRASQLGLADGASVATWVDEGSGGHDLTASGSSQPVLKVDGFNGHPCVTFDGVDDFMDAPYDAALPQPTTVILIVKYRYEPFDRAFFNSVVGDPEAQQLRLFFGDWLIYASPTAGSLFGGLSTDVPQVLEAWFDSANAGYAVDGVPIDSTTVGSGGLNGLKLASTGGTPAQRCMDMDVAEVLVYDRLLITQERADLQDYYEATYLTRIADDFSGDTLNAKWTFEPGTPAATLSVAGGECPITAQPGASYEAPSQISTADTAFGITQPALAAGIGADFDIAVHAPTSLRSWTDQGWGIAFYGSTKTSDHLVVEQLARGVAHANSTSQRILSRVAGALTTHVDDVAGNEEYSFIRVARSGDTWTVYGSWDGAAWTSLASFAAAFAVDTVKIYGSVATRQLGMTLRIAETYDVTSQGADLRDQNLPLSGTTTWSTDFTAGVPSWLEDKSSNGGSATVVSNQLNLAKTTTDASSALVALDALVGDVDLLVKFRIDSSELGSPGQFLVFGIGGQHQTDQYSLDRSHVMEVDEDFNNIIPLRVHRRNRNRDFNAIYDFGPAASPAGWANDQWQWVRFQRIGGRVRYRGWADADGFEPSSWDFDAHNELWKEPGRVWITWAHNDTGTANTTALVDEITIQGVEAQSSTPSGVDAIPGLVGRWRADSLEGLADNAEVEGWHDLSPAGQWSLWRRDIEAPTYAHAAIGGHNAVRFSGIATQRLHTILDFPTWLDRSAVSMVAVLKMATTTGTQVITDGESGRNAVFVDSSTWRYFAGTVVDSSDTVDLNSHVLTTVFATTRTESAQYLDGMLIGSGTPGSGILDRLLVGAEDNGINPADVYVSEIFLFNREITASDRSRLRFYVRDRYGITTADIFVDAPPAESTLTAHAGSVWGNVTGPPAASTIVAPAGAVDTLPAGTFGRYRAAALRPTLFDSFTDTDGKSLDNHTAETGQCWNTPGSWSIAAGGFVTTSAPGEATIPPGATEDGYTVTLVTQPPESGDQFFGPLARYIDSDNSIRLVRQYTSSVDRVRLLLEIESVDILCDQWGDGPGSTGLDPQAELELQLVVAGDQIRGFVNGIERINYTLTQSEAAALGSHVVGNVGIYDVGTAASHDSITVAPAVSIWADESGNGNDLVQPAATVERPVYEPAGFNGHPAVHFDGVGQWLQTAAYAVELAQPTTLILMLEWHAVTNGVYLVDGLGTGRNAVLVDDDGGTKYRLYANTLQSADTGPAVSDQICLVAVFDGSGSALYVDGALVLDGLHPGMDGLAGLTLGARYSGVSFAPVRVAEALVYDRALTPAEVSDVQDYFVATYGNDGAVDGPPAVMTVAVPGGEVVGDFASSGNVDGPPAALTLTVPAGNVAGNVAVVDGTPAAHTLAAPAGAVTAVDAGQPVVDGPPAAFTVAAPAGQVGAQLPSGSYGRYRAASLALVDNDPVAIWPDESGNGHDLEQPVADDRPFYDSAGFNGHPAVNLGDGSLGTGRWMQTGAYPTELAQPNTIVVMLEWHDIATGVYVADGDAAGTGRHAIIVDEVTGPKYRLYAGGVVTASAGPAINTPSCLVAVFEGDDTAQLYDNETLILDHGAVGTDGMAGLTLGARYTGEAYAPIRVAEVLVYDRALTPQEVANLQDYFTAAYLSAPGASVNGPRAEYALSAPAGEAAGVGSGSVDGPPATYTMTAPAGEVTGVGVANVDGPAITYTMTAPAGEVAAIQTATVDGPPATTTLTAPAGEVAASATVTVDGPAAVSTLTTPAGDVISSAVVDGPQAEFILTAPAGAVTGAETEVTAFVLESGAEVAVELYVLESGVEVPVALSTL